MNLRSLAFSLVALGLAACHQPQPASEAATASIPRVGGPFRLVDVDNRPITERVLLGKPRVIFFGFTYCPEVCPTTLAKMTAALEALGPDADRLNVVFISVDPERDTPEQMRRYLSNFDPRIKGFTGTPEQVEAAAGAYRIYRQKVALDGGGYTVDHTSAVYLFDRRGVFADPLSHGASLDMVVARLRKLIAAD